MNAQLNRLAVLALVLLVALVVATTYWQAWAAGSLQAKQDNQIQRVVQFTIARGLIEGPEGKPVFAVNKRVPGQGGQTFYFRRYPGHGLAAQTIGYSTRSRSQAGLEQSMNDYLTGSNTNLGNAFRNVLNRLGGATVHGDNLVLTLRPGLQRLAQQQLGSRCGAVVVMNPHTGAIYAMASSPTYDPNLIDRPGGYAKVLRIRGQCHGASALFNRATNGLFTPGSTFKIVTAAAALDTGTYKLDSTFYDPGYCKEYGKPVYNAGNPDQNGPEAYGHPTLAVGFQHSINSVFCNIGMKLGAGTVLEYARRFGFFKTPPLETPGDERAPSGTYKFSPHGNRLDPDPAHADPGRLAFGQWTMLASPLQMAMVASAVANGGVVPRPYLVKEITTRSGEVVRRTKPSNLGRAIKAETAAELNRLMVSVVQGGTGTAAQIPGIQVAGKTGTAETGTPHVYTAWFVSFAPADDPKYAVAVVLENQLNGFGGQVSAPIAKTLLQALLKG
jgi:peptidoglycan glycosyltransferase